MQFPIYQEYEKILQTPYIQKQIDINIVFFVLYLQFI